MTEPINLPEAKLHLKVETTVEDGWITDAIVAAREIVEGYSGHILTRRTITQEFRRFSPWLDLLGWPIVSIDSITYLDSARVQQTLGVETYSLANGQRPVRVSAVGYWPHTAGNVIVTATAGYATPEDVPGDLKQAVKVALTGLYSFRAGLPDDVLKGIRNLCRQKRRSGC